MALNKRRPGRTLPRAPPKPLFRGAMCQIVRKELQKEAEKANQPSPTEEILVPALADRWSYLNHKKRFDALAAKTKFSPSPLTIKQTEHKRAYSELKVKNKIRGASSKLKEASTHRRISTETDGLESLYSQSFDNNTRDRDRSTDSVMRNTNASMMNDNLLVQDFSASAKIKSFKYVKIPKQPFAVHSPTRDAIAQSPKFDDIIVKHKRYKPIDVPLKLAKHHRKLKPELLNVSQRRKGTAQALVEARALLNTRQMKYEKERRSPKLEPVQPPSMIRVLGNIGSRQASI